MFKFLIRTFTEGRYKAHWGSVYKVQGEGVSKVQAFENFSKRGGHKVQLNLLIIILGKIGKNSHFGKGGIYKVQGFENFSEIGCLLGTTIYFLDKLL